MAKEDDGRLQGKRALITGAGSGIGLAITRMFAGEGAHIAAVTLHEESLRRLKDVPNLVPIQADITKLDEIDRMVADAERWMEQIDIVCNVAGINDLGYPLDETSDERWDKVFELDLKAPFRICRKVIPGMVARASGVILNIGSYAATRGNHGPSYTAAKHGLIGLSLSIAVYYGGKGIRCNVINPGAVQTDIEKHSGGTYHPEGFAMFMAIAEKLPVKWACDPQEIAPVALFLCSDEARYVNGAVVAVDGGMSAC